MTGIPIGFLRLYEFMYGVLLIELGWGVHISPPPRLALAMWVPLLLVWALVIGFAEGARVSRPEAAS